MWSVFIHSTSPGDAEFLSAELFDFGSIGIEETPGGLRAYFEAATDVCNVSHILVGLRFEIETDVPPVSGHEANDWDPVLIGNRFVLVPSGRIVLPIDAGMAFGSGRHETTQLCLQALEKHVKRGDVVYDVGCGSGILALAALKVGAGLVVGSDIDENAVRVARRHFQGALFVGSADGLPQNSADVVMANITGQVDDHIALDLKRITKANGIIILSGFTNHTRPGYFRAMEQLNLGEWECWICSPADIHAPENADPNSHKTQWWL